MQIKELKISSESNSTLVLNFIGAVIIGSAAVSSDDAQREQNVNVEL
jgi:hypothetical protein